MTSNTCSVYRGVTTEQTFCRTSAPDDTTQRPWKGVIPMAFIRVDPVQVQVRTDWFTGRPREITWGDERLPITRLAVVREEAAAYPVITGPRTLFEVDTPRARLSLTFQHRSRRWTVTGLDDEVRRAA
ncbi:MAG: hypothetical protein A2Z32_04115 [Chloroflexi bacterium RBG_16_69_14]|nr:MAG: hypothetical protein A2Z32_04115 [Chloroflexi bacterium RBG_16_69_14]